MSHTIPLQKKPAQRLQAVFDATHDAADADSLALHRLANLVKLCAFASEARRVLEGTDGALLYQPKAQEAIRENVTTCRTWIGMPDVTGEVLTDVAQQLEELGEAISRRPFDLQTQTLEGGAA